MESARRTFAIDRCLGRGGFGEVYRAEMTSSMGLSTSVALKVLRRDVSPGSQAMQRLKDEGQLLARLNHPTILRVHDLVVLEGRVSLITEFVDGEDLERCLRGAGRIGPRALIELVGQVASALDSAYNAPVGEDGAPLKLVHRDVKPSNLRIGRHGEVKLLDFGIARSDEVTREARTSTNMMVGSPPYMAPERFLDAELRAASDVFGLGAIVLEGLSGRRVFEQPVTVLAALAIDRRRFEAFVEARFQELDEDAPPEVVTLAREMLAYEPGERPTAAELSRRCEVLLDLVEGPSLARWCRERVWREPPWKEGELAGRVVSEETLADQTVSISQYVASTTVPIALEPTSSRTGPMLALWVGGASVVSTAMLLSFLLLAGLAAAIWSRWSEPVVLAPISAPIPTPPRIPVAPPVISPPTPPPVEAPPVGGPPVGGAPVKARAPSSAEKAPAPRQTPAPEVAPPPAPPTPAPAAVKVSATGATSVFLVRGDERIQLPSTVAPGTWEVRATFPNTGELPQSPVTVEGEEVRLLCTTRLQKCRKEE